MRTRVLLTVSMLVLTAGAAVTMAVGPQTNGGGFTSDFGLEHCKLLVPDGGNRYMSLEPGRYLRLEGFNEEGEFEEKEITTLAQTLPVRMGPGRDATVALTRVVEEREWLDGELAQVSYNYFARCPDTNNIYYFGETVDHYEDDEIVGHEGSWLAGVDGARPGLAMPGTFLIGSRYYMELAPGESMDRGEHLAMNLVVETPAGAFQNCIMVEETSDLEPDEETLKIYSQGVGVIVDDHLRLVDFRL
jgi:hypothetical protein